LSHILYFEGFERHRANDTGSLQKLAVADWIAGRELVLDDVDPGPLRRFLAFIVYVAIIALLLAAAAGLATMAAAAADFILADKLTIALDWDSFLRIGATVAGAALALILMMGVLRWGRESGLNQRLAIADGKSRKVRRALGRQKWAAVVLGVPLTLLVLAALAVDLGLAKDLKTAGYLSFPDLSQMPLLASWWAVIADWADWASWWALMKEWMGWWTLILAGGGTAIAAWTQALINHKDVRLGLSEDRPSAE
jgi:hypothetical protein